MCAGDSVNDNRQSCPGLLPIPLSRRDMLQRSAGGFGLLALSALLAEQSRADEPRPHFAPRAKNVIFCFMDGGVSHVDSFDPKPELDRRDNQLFTDSRNPSAMGNRRWLKSPWAFRRRGRSGLPLSDLFPHLATCADKLAIIRSMKADLPIHST